MSARASPPVLDFSPFYGEDDAAKAKLIESIKECCLYNGFFQIIGHRVPIELQRAVMRCTKRFFELPLEQKLEIDKNNNTFNRGYELLRSQMLEAGSGPELKEGLYIGEEIPEDHPYFIQRKLNSSPKDWPQTIEARRISAHLHGILPRRIRLGQRRAGMATMRFLHYPAQPKDADEKLNRGIGAHTDFGCVTLLLQDEVDGLQVLDVPTGEWLDVQPVPGTYVVNLGNLFMRMANDKYKSNTHRVIKKSGRERYSISFFFSGNPDYLCEFLPNCREQQEAPKYGPIAVEQAVMAAYNESYDRAEKYKQEMKVKLETIASPAVVAA